MYDGACHSMNFGFYYLGNWIAEINKLLSNKFKSFLSRNWRQLNFVDTSLALYVSGKVVTLNYDEIFCLVSCLINGRNILSALKFTVN